MAELGRNVEEVMRKMWKFSVVPVVGIQEVEMPAGSTIHHLGKDLVGCLCLWAACPDGETVPKVRHRVLLAFTGDEVPEVNARHFGTIIFNGLVIHAFDLGEPR